MHKARIDAYFSDILPGLMRARTSARENSVPPNQTVWPAVYLCAACRDPANGAAPNVTLMQRIPPASTIVAYFDFVFKVSRPLNLQPPA
jgi:hypothetical protein